MKDTIVRIMMALTILGFLLAGLGFFLFGQAMQGIYTESWIESHGEEITMRWLWIGIIVASMGPFLAILIWMGAKMIGEKNVSKDERERQIMDRAGRISFSLLMALVYFALAYTTFMDMPERMDLLGIATFGMLSFIGSYFIMKYR